MNMENSTEKSNRMIADAYTGYHDRVFRYIVCRINDTREAEDLAQDVYLRLMDYKQLICEETMQSFVFTIARNLVNDYLRRYYKRQEVTAYMYEYAETATNEPESRILADDLEACERRLMQLLPTQRGKVYELSRYDDLSAAEISEQLQLSQRTVENHLYISRTEMRAYMRMCI